MAGRLCPRAGQPASSQVASNVHLRFSVRRIQQIMSFMPEIGFAMLATLLASTLSATAMIGLPDAQPLASTAPHVELVQANCDAAARQVVAQTGGQLLSVSPGANGTCTVTVLVPGQGNERPRKVTMSVPG
jgi:hypothetical protein